jgi:hypothetical protein
MTETAHGLEHVLTNYGDRDFSLYLRRSFAQSMGYSRAMLAKPVIGIAYTPSGFNNCHRHFPELLEAVKRGVLAAGALVPTREVAERKAADPVEEARPLVDATEDVAPALPVACVPPPDNTPPSVPPPPPPVLPPPPPRPPALDCRAKFPPPPPIWARWKPPLLPALLRDPRN